MEWLRRLKHEWTKNDGKPREEWAPGRDLKEVVAIGLLSVLLIAQAILTAMMLFG